MAPKTSVTDVFTAVAEPRRRQIIELLAQRPGLAVGAIVLALGLRQPDVSKHLSVLRQVGIVTASKQGQHRIYDLNPEPLKPLSAWVKSLEAHWEGQIDRIRVRAERKALERSRSANSSTPEKGTQ
ncbi:metalloregulator ArsR/SmtB family transcription factor [soil metagenome]